MSEPRTYLVGLPVVVTVYPDGRVLLEVDASEADAAILEDDNLYADAAAYTRALDDRDLISAAHAARRIRATVNHPRSV